MIITLTGNVSFKAEDFAVVETGGIGYQVRFNKHALMTLQIGQAIRIWTHEHIREDARELFGFMHEGEHRVFLKLVAISGVGPKMAQNILSLGSVREIENIIEQADVERISSIPGVGKKTAQKIVLELKGKLALEASGDDELIQALMGLGYSKDQARAAAAGAEQEGAVEERLRSALKAIAA